MNTSLGYFVVCDKVIKEDQKTIIEMPYGNINLQGVFPNSFTFSVAVGIVNLDFTKTHKLNIYIKDGEKLLDNMEARTDVLPNEVRKQVPMLEAVYELRNFKIEEAFDMTVEVCLDDESLDCKKVSFF